ncbi:MAG: phenylalanine--tRNA ligase subunit alpha [Candidatus Dadabacteria bacterium]|nr:phenylalanine--tRNA ligase subunit alpha [Candidatus Dadabacteria bacterium]NIQ15390.1 phenylalanine--tRNA ligase subunit alpha [Candidatus Dadabacteria bacterium]
MIEQLDKAKETIAKDLEDILDETTLVQVKARYLGKKGLITDLLKSMRDIPSEQRRDLGKRINEVKNYIEELIENKSEEIKKGIKEKALLEEKTDFTLPGRGMPIGAKHPITQVMEHIIYNFERMGFEVKEGPEVELDYYNFEALNIPKDHPARDMQDTFYITDDIVLRTHTSPVQIRVMQSQQPPVKIIAPGKVYRCDSDVSHTPMFHQIEGLLVDKDITFGNLKSVITQFVRLTFGDNTNLRFRPSFFPFTEPSAEVDIECKICSGKGCRVCKDTGWLEVLGCGMVDPEVFKSVGYDTEIYTGFAFGMGVERIAMLLYGINDIRLFFENDVRFLRQFV